MSSAANDRDVGAILAILRIVRGWSRGELGEAAGVPGSSLSQYERNLKTPELATLQKLLSVMGYPLDAVEEAQRFVHALRLGVLPERDPGAESEDVEAFGSQGKAALRFEMRQASAEFGRAVARLARIGLVLLEAPRDASALPEDE